MEKRLSALVFGAAMMGVLAGCDHFASAKEGEPVSGKVISSAIQPAARLDVKNGTYVWSVADWLGAKAETTVIETPLVPGGKSLEAVWRKQGAVIRRETYPLPADAAAFARELEEDAARIVIPFEMPFDGKATVVVDTPDGVRVKNVVNGLPFGKGRHEVVWDGYREDGTLAAPGEYKTRIAVHPGLSYDYLGYFACGGDPDQWNAWGPNHLYFIRTFLDFHASAVNIVFFLFQLLQVLL